MHVWGIKTFLSFATLHFIFAQSAKVIESLCRTDNQDWITATVIQLISTNRLEHTTANIMH